MGKRIHNKRMTHTIAFIFTILAMPTLAALTDISNTPITRSGSTEVKPNIMLLMDTSGSMGWGHMPDEVESVTGVGSVGYKSSQCNVLYYNPNTIYRLPKDSAGNDLPEPSFTAAQFDAYDHFVTGLSNPVDLSTAFKAYQTATLRTAGFNDLAQPAYYYVYSGTQNTVYSAAPCTDPDTGVTKAAIGGGTWTRVVVSATSGTNSTIGPDERQNFARWYAYYRTRIAMVKSAVSLAFQFSPSTSENYRLGFITVQPKTLPTDATIDSSKYVPIADFDSTQRTLWFNKLFSQRPGGASPAREGLARVGRHYGGMQDGINEGMTGDPVQYSCQQNFTIMTTDGYWNAQTESQLSSPFVGGGARLDGEALVGNQDNLLTGDDGLTPRPIWEGQANGTEHVVDKNLIFSYASCPMYSMTTSQLWRNTSQLLKSTSQLTRSTSQFNESTAQINKSTSQLTRSTTQLTQSTSQLNQSTSQINKSTSQLTRSTSQDALITWQLQKSTAQINKSTSQINKSTSQLTKSTSQLTKSTLQKNKSTSQKKKSTSQLTRSTSQLTESTLQINKSTSQINKSTTQNLQSTSQIQRTDTQILSCNAATELCTPVATCTAGGLISCSTQTSGPTPVASCTTASANAGNNYTSTTCSTVNTGPTPVASCTAASPSAGNNYTTITCSTNNTGPTPVASCTAAAASSSNSYTTTSCNTVTSGPTPVASCTAASPSSSNSYTTTTCNNVTTGPVGVASCTNVSASSGNNYTATTCNTVTTGPTGVASCTNASASSSNSYTTTTCATATTGPTPVASCTNASASSSNNYTTTTCDTVTTGPTPVASCTNESASSGNSYTTTTCTNVTTGPTGVASCTNESASSGNSYTATTCNTVTTGPTGVSSCTNASASSGNSYTATTCNTVTTGPTPVSSCTNASASSGNSYTATTCNTVTTGPTNVGTCTAESASSSNDYTSTSCNTVQTASTPVAPGTCVPQAINGSGVSKTCSTITTGPTGVASCTASGPTAGNNYTTTTCNTLTTGPTPVASCTNASASSGNSYTATTCNTVTTGPTPVASCTNASANAGNSYTTTSCSTATTGPTGVASCTPVSASAGNSYTATTCNTATTGPTGVASCTAQGPNAGNSYVDTTCATVTTGPTPVASCSNTSANAGNSYTATSCNTVTTGPTPVPSCSNVAANAGNSYTATTCTNSTTGPTGVASCTAELATAGNSYTTTSCNTVTTGPTGVASCTNETASAGNSYTDTTCNTAVTGPTLVDSCTAAAAGSGNSYVQTTCDIVTVSGPTLVSSCTAVAPSAGNGHTATNCTYVPGQKIVYATQTSVTNTATSNGHPVGASSTSTTTSGNSDLEANACYTGTMGDTLPALPPAQKAGLPVSGFSAAAIGPSDWDASCTGWPCTTTIPSNDGSVNSLADVAQYYYVTDLRPDADWPSNIAQNDVRAVGAPPEGDWATWQHMVTFTMALGYSGTLNYKPDYKTATTGDFADIRCNSWTAATTDPFSGEVTPPSCLTSKPWPEWPDPALDYSNANNWNNPKAIDDFWHTAVNGRGQYFSAGSPLSVVSGMTQALSGITAQLGTGSAVGVSTLQPIVGDNYLFLASYKTSDWVGDVKELTIDPSTGEINTTPVWSAQAKLDLQTGSECDNRKIYLVHPGATDNLVNFTWNTKECDSSGVPTGSASTGLDATEKSYFGATQVAQLSQYSSPVGVSAVAQATAAEGANLVNFLRGQRSLEGYDPNDTSYSTSDLYRTRAHVLGDIVGGSPIYVKAPFASYQDGVLPSYSDFKLANANRAPMLYVPANDGMLHAFYVGTSTSDSLGGKEAWAIIPSMVLPNLHKLADNNYSTAHRYFVDGTVSVGDAYDRDGVVLGATHPSWRTILVAGLNKGGQGYYALDITDPENPKALWEFKNSTACGSAGDTYDCNLGYSYVQPAITKLINGRWVVIVTSGYNNVPPLAPNGDGHGYLYVLDAFTGEIISKTDTGVGDATTPSGLAQISAFVSDADHDNTSLRVYGGDLLGNVWRFNINSTTPTATLLGTAKDTSGNPQPISVAPELGLVRGKPMVLVGTGLLLGSSDLSNNQMQSVYGIVDPLTEPATPGDPIYSNFRTSFALDAMTVDTNGNRTTSCASNCTSLYGWVLDLPHTTSGAERINVNMQLVFGTLAFISNLPNNSACSSGGYSYVNYVNYLNGLPIKVAREDANGNVVINTNTGYLNSNSLVTGHAIITLGTPTGGNSGGSNLGNYGGIGNVGGTNTITTDNTGVIRIGGIPIVPPAPGGKRVSWHEIVE